MNKEYFSYRLSKAIQLLEEAKDALSVPHNHKEASKQPLDGKRVCVCIGHSRPGDYGAIAFDEKTTEFAWNRVVGITLRDNLVALGAKVLLLDLYGDSERGYLSYGQAMDWVADKTSLFCREYPSCCVELHFNSASDTVRGFETLVSGSERSVLLGTCLQKEMAGLFQGEPDRGVKTRRRAERGSGFLFKTTPPAAILEPLFASNEKSWNRWKNERDEIAYAYCRGIQKYFEQLD
jgi:N-acetylmuramoyl-L-alanine amidase